MSSLRNATRRVFLGKYRIFWLSWLVMTAALISFVYKQVPRYYEATAILEVEANDASVLLPVQKPVDLAAFMETQIQFLTSADVISLALKDPKVAAIPWVRQAANPEEMVRKKLRVTIPPKSHVLVLSMTTSSPADGAQIINAVVDAYIEVSGTLVSDSTKKLIKQYKEAQDKFENDVTRLRDQMTELTKKTGKADPLSNPALEDYNRYRARLSQVEMERIEAEVALQVASQEAQAGSDKATRTDDALGKAIRAQFLDREEVVEARRSFAEAEKALQQAEAAGVPEPDRVALKNRVAERKSKLDELWAKEVPALRGLLLDNTAVATSGREQQTLRYRLALLNEEERELRKRLDSIKIERKEPSEERLQAEFYETDLKRASESLARVTAMIQSLELENSGHCSVSKVSAAKLAPAPSWDPRPALAAASPVVAFVVMLGLFTLGNFLTGPLPGQEEPAGRA